MTTNAEQSWMDAISRLGCVVCHIQGYPNTPAEIHHMLSGGRRIGHLWTIPLCAPGHHRYGDGVLKISR
ncbi:MAG: Ref family recombination enhancement nuclease, partial [Rhodanobacter sp.]